MNNSWIFTVKSSDGKIERQELYGSVRAISDNENIVVGVKEKSEAGLRRMLKSSLGCYEDARYRIEKKDIIRVKRFPI